jgi:CheY-like chemotaxis protein
MPSRPKLSRPSRSQNSGSRTSKGSRPGSFQDKRSKTHVLLVEDNIINQKIVHRKLEAKGFKVTTASNGRQAVDATRNAPKPSSGDESALDVILMDQEMPVLDGNAATKEIRELEAKGEVEYVPILGVTANVRDAQLDEMRASGMDDVISKPYKIDDLVAKISSAIQLDNGDA